MSLDQTISDDLKTAMKARDKVKTGALRQIRAAFIEALKADGATSLAADKEMEILKRLAKQRRESIEAYEKGGREELAAEEQAELEVIEAYLPTVAGEEQTRTWVDEAIAATGASSMRDMGKIMGHLMKGHKDVLDAKLANEMIKARLG